MHVGAWTRSVQRLPGIPEAFREAGAFIRRPDRYPDAAVERRHPGHADEDSALLEQVKQAARPLAVPARVDGDEVGGGLERVQIPCRSRASCSPSRPSATCATTERTKSGSRNDASAPTCATRFTAKWFLILLNPSIVPA